MSVAGEGSSKSQRQLSRVWLVVFGVVFAFSAGEIAFRFAGNEAGYVPAHSGSFERVDRFQAIQSFQADAEGMFRANPGHGWSADTIVNSDGFRSIPFEPSPTGSPSVLFVGDSFTWGASASPLTESFVDLVAREGLVCFNGGIPGTDPAQYALVAERYTPRLRPDVVAAVMYLGNDIHRDLLPVLPHQPPWYVTNAGWLSGFDHERKPLASAEESYAYHVSRSNRIGSENLGICRNTLRKLLTQSAVGSLLWAEYWASPAPDPEESWTAKERSSRKLERAVATRQCLDRIRQAATSVGARFELFLIPVRPDLENSLNRVDGNILLFQGYDPQVPNSLTAEHYEPAPGLHFNNRGHRAYADFLLENLEF